MRQNLNSDSYKTLSERIKAKADELGIDMCGIARAEYLEKEDERITSWVSSGYNAGMSYLSRNSDKRADPRKLVENAKSVIVCLVSYRGDSDATGQFPKVARYAHGVDYHILLKDKLHKMLGIIKEEYPQALGRVFVDSAPVMERSWAVRAGLGWIGRNSMLINRHLGSYTFIGEIITDIELDYNEPSPLSYCGSCSKCITACPNRAILPDKTIDSNRCISYLTIEHIGDLPAEFENNNEGWVFGCDICQEVCPWNSKPATSSIPELYNQKDKIIKALKNWNGPDRASVDEVLESTSLNRAGFESISRNIAIAAKANRY